MQSKCVTGSIHAGDFGHSFGRKIEVSVITITTTTPTPFPSYIQNTGFTCHDIPTTTMTYYNGYLFFFKWYGHVRFIYDIPPAQEQKRWYLYINFSYKLKYIEWDEHENDRSPESLDISNGEKHWKMIPSTNLHNDDTYLDFNFKTRSKSYQTENPNIQRVAFCVEDGGQNNNNNQNEDDDDDDDNDNDDSEDDDDNGNDDNNDNDDDNDNDDNNSSDDENDSDSD